MRIRGIGLLVFFVILMHGCSTGKQSSSLNQIVERVNSGQAILLDVRTKGEYEKIRATGARHIPLSDLQSGRIPDIDLKDQIYTYCRSGARSEKARKILLKIGYRYVKNLGGIETWKKAGGQVESGDS